MTHDPSLQAQIVHTAMECRDAVRNGPMTADDIARRYNGRGLTYPSIRALIDPIIDIRSSSQSVTGRRALLQGTVVPAAPVEIGPLRLKPATWQNERVVTLAMVDEVHRRPEGTARRNFGEHERRLIEGQDFFRVRADEIRAHKALPLSTKAHGEIILLTETGYLMLVKSFTDPLAWDVQRTMVSSYFRQHQGAVASAAIVPLRSPQLTPDVVGGIVKRVSGALIAASEDRTLAHMDAMIQAAVAELKQELTQQPGRHAETNRAAIPPPLTVAPIENAMGYLSARAAVRMAGGTGNMRRLVQLASASLRRFCAGVSTAMVRSDDDGRWLFDVGAVRAWLDSGGRDRLIFAGR